MKLLGISGSLRKGSYNTMLVKEAARLFEPSEFVLADLNLPLFNQDLEAEGMPEPVQVLCDQIAAADAIVISTPEYNKAPSGVLKNALDWVSRPRPAPMVGKPLSIVAATASAPGGERTRAALYLMLIAFKPRFCFYPEVGIGQAGDRFDAEGRLTDEAREKLLAQQMQALKALAAG